MNLRKCLLISLILTLIVAICKAEIMKESTSYSSRPRIAENSLIEGSSGRVDPSAYNSGKTRAVRPQRPNVAPIRPGYPARSDSWRFQAPEATSWREPQSSKPQRELIFVSRRNMRERSGAAGSDSRRRHSRRRHHHRNNSEGNQAPRVQTPTELPIRPAFTTEPSASFRYRNPEAFARSGLQSSFSQREQIFVSPPQHIRERFGAAGSNSTRRHSRRRHHHRNNSEGTQAPRVQTPTELPIRPAFTTEPSASFRYRNPEAFARSGLQSSNSQREQIFVPPPRHARTKPDTAEDEPRKGHSRKMHHHKKHSGKDQASRKRRPNIYLIRSELTTESPPSAVIQIVLE